MAYIDFTLYPGNRVRAGICIGWWWLHFPDIECRVVNKDHVREVMLSFQVRYRHDNGINSQQVFHAKERLKETAALARESPLSFATRRVVL